MSSTIRFAFFCICLCMFAGSGVAELLPHADGMAGAWRPVIRDGGEPIFSAYRGGAGTPVIVATAAGSERFEVQYARTENLEGAVQFTDGRAGALYLEETYRPLGKNLVERVIQVKAEQDARYYVEFGWHVDVAGAFHSFSQLETATARYSPSCSGPEFGGGSLQTFPFLGCLTDGTVYGILGESPGLWENRSFMGFDVEGRNFSLANGDGSVKRTVQIPFEYDATTVYRGEFDGWQHIEAGETQEWRTWIFASPSQSRYDVQLAAHLALANAQGFNQSGLEAILRNTSYLLLRRNLLRPESDYIFISGVGYGWKQWVTDGFYMSRGLDIPAYDVAAHAGVFYDRISYEDNAQYYLIWSVLARRAGAELDMRTVDRAYRFMRKHERDGLFVPPRLKPETAAFKTYHDLLPYDDDDAPSSNQGFHCGALLAARELGYEVSDAEIEAAKAGYRRMFNADGGYMATSLKQQQHIGQDSLYGEVLTYAVLGEKLLPDEMVQQHVETSLKLQTPYGMRVISTSDGELLDGHSGVYVFGGSWFLNDACVLLDGLIHGMDASYIDDKLLWRLERELAVMPAFHESISTVDGNPHGHHLYSWNSGFWWLRREVRERMGMQGPDPLAQSLDERLGIVSVDGVLYLRPERATLRPEE